VNDFFEGKYSDNEVVDFIEKNQEKVIKFIEEQLKMALDTSKTLPSPRWVSYHGAKAAEGIDATIPEDQWKRVRSEYAESVLGMSPSSNSDER